MLELFKSTLLLVVDESRNRVNEFFQSQDAFLIAGKTFVFSVLLTYVYCYLSQLLREGDEVWRKRLRKWIFKKITSLPIVKQKIAEKIGEVQTDIEHSTFLLKDQMTYITKLPETGFSSEEIFQVIEDNSVLTDFDVSNLSGQVYTNDSQLRPLTARVYEKFGYTNPLHADVFQDVRKMEAEVTRMVCTMFNGGPKSRALVTAGGSESLLLALLAARNRAYLKGIRYPEVVMPVTAHAAMDKACFYFRVKAVHVPVDQKSYHMDMKKFKGAITKNTCLLFGSCPDYPYGVMDPIEEISKLGIRYGIPVHVDACLGGFVVAFMEKAGFPIALFDFRLDGVMSISCDTHKYGFAPKGTSTLCFRDAQYMQNVYYSQPDWPGGIYATPTTLGSRSGGLIATAWFVLLYHGERGYIESTTKVVKTTRALAEGISKVKGLKLMGDPKVCVVSWTSDEIDILRQYELLTKRNWVLGTTQFPSGIRLTVTMNHCNDQWIERFMNDIKETAAECFKFPEVKAQGQAAMYGMSQVIPDRSVVQQVTYMFYNKYYSTQ